MLRISGDASSGSGGGAGPGGAAGIRTYTIVPGDTLWDIARRFGTTVAHLAALNDIANPNLIYPGEVFLIG